MFENLSDRFVGIFDKLRRSAVLREEDVTAAMREVRTALLEADVALPVVKSFIRKTQRRAVGQAVMRSVSPGDLVIKIVHDELVALLAADESASAELSIARSPSFILMVGLQGSGKTTTTAKIARHLTVAHGKRVLMASLDTRRPAAMEQLAILGEQNDIDTLPINNSLSAVEIARAACREARDSRYDVCLLDTAGRLHVDDALMTEVEEVRDATEPHETLLIADGLTGQDAVNVAEEFGQRIRISGVVLTRMDGDGRGGAALSMRAITGKPIKFIGEGEKIDALSKFDPERIAGRILGMGDIVALVERAAETLDKEKIERAVKRLAKGQFNMNDMRQSLEFTLKLGGLSEVSKMLPGNISKLEELRNSGIDEKFLKHQLAIISSMTRFERANPQQVNGSRRKRIAAGSGRTVADVNQLLKSQQIMSKAVKRAKNPEAIRNMLKTQMGKNSAQEIGTGAGLPDLAPSNATLARMQFGAGRRGRR